MYYFWTVIEWVRTRNRSVIVFLDQENHLAMQCHATFPGATHSLELARTCSICCIEDRSAVMGIAATLLKSPKIRSKHWCDQIPGNISIYDWLEKQNMGFELLPDWQVYELWWTDCYTVRVTPASLNTPPAVSRNELASTGRLDAHSTVECSQMDRCTHDSRYLWYLFWGAISIQRSLANKYLNSFLFCWFNSSSKTQNTCIPQIIVTLQV